MGGERIEQEFNVEQIIRQLRDIDFIMKEQILDKKTQFLIHYSHKNVIYVDEEENDHFHNSVLGRSMSQSR